MPPGRKKNNYIDERPCNHCKVVKPMSEFHVGKSVCKICRKLMSVEYYDQTGRERYQQKRAI